ncbi:MAG: hypothetical protein ABIW82_07725 [Dokdonella sp.]
MTVNSDADPADGNAANCGAGNPTTCTLRDAIAAASGGNDTIVFDSDMTITLARTLTLATSVTIDASDFDVTTTATKPSPCSMSTPA